MKKQVIVDVAKSIGIVLVVLGHALPEGYIHQLIYSFHMPLFFFLSGYFFSSTYFKEKVLFLKKRLKRLYLPFLLFSACFLLLHNLFLKWHFYAADQVDYSLSETLHAFLLTATRMSVTEPLLAVYWFLKDLLIASCLVLFLLAFVRSLWKNKWGEWGVLLLLLCLSLLVDKWGPAIGVYSHTLLAAAYYLFGYRYKKMQISFYHGGSSLLLSTFILCLWVYCCGEPFSNGMLGLSPTMLPLYFLASLVGIYTLLGWSALLSRSSLAACFCYVGQRTLWVFTLHLLAFKLVSFGILLLYQLPLTRLSEGPILHVIGITFWWAYLVAGVCLPLFVLFLFRSIGLNQIGR